MMVVAMVMVMAADFFQAVFQPFPFKGLQAMMTAAFPFLKFFALVMVVVMTAAFFKSEPLTIKAFMMMVMS